MARPEMTARAVTVRLLRTEQLRRLCLALRRGQGPTHSAKGGAPAPAKAIH
jgi:hypothetical protein